MNSNKELRHVESDSSRALYMKLEQWINLSELKVAQPTVLCSVQ